MSVENEEPESNNGPANSGPGLADENTVRALLARANLLRIRRQWDEAIAACTEALRYDPRSSAAHSLLGDIYEAQEKPEDAIQWFAMALEIDPKNAKDRAKLDRLTATQRIRLRTQDIAAAAASPAAPKRERTLEWFDRVFPPGRSDSVARLILAMSLGFAAIMVLCTGFIYFFIVPRHDATLETAPVALPSDTVASDVPMPSAPVVMTPSNTETHAEKTTTTAEVQPVHTTGEVTAAEHPTTATRVSSAVAVHPANVVAVATTADPATLRTRLAPVLNTSEMQLAGVTPGPNGALYLDLALPAATTPESTDRLRERALRAASLGAHALAAQVSSEMDHAFVRIAVALAPTASHPATNPKTLIMVFAAEMPLRYFRDADVSGMTASDLAGRFQSAQWYSATPTPGTAATTDVASASASVPNTLVGAGFSGTGSAPVSTH